MHSSFSSAIDWTLNLSRRYVHGSTFAFRRSWRPAWMRSTPCSRYARAVPGETTLAVSTPMVLED
eukprot:7489447-Pyramimonas_sp.AAC.2